MVCSELKESEKEKGKGERESEREEERKGQEMSDVVLHALNFFDRRHKAISCLLLVVQLDVKEHKVFTPCPLFATIHAALCSQPRKN